MEAEIAALIALQRYFEEKIVRLPNWSISSSNLR
jgi:hypothetical protein